MIKGLAHVCFTVRDLDASIAFYQEKLGFTPAFDFINDRGERFGVYLHLSAAYSLSCSTRRKSSPRRASRISIFAWRSTTFELLLPSFEIAAWTWETSRSGATIRGRRGSKTPTATR